jgi:RNA polymerase sigma-70 factor (ECF subfamily)
MLYSGVRSEFRVMDHRRFLQHFVANERLLTGYLLAATGDFHEAEDLLQEVSVALWESFDRYDESRAFHSWALGVARHKVLDWRERRGRRGPVLSMDMLEALECAEAVETALLAERRPLLQKCMESLPAHLRELVELRYGDGLHLDEVATRLKKSVGAVQMTFVRIRRALRDCVDRKLGPAAEASR